MTAFVVGLSVAVSAAPADAPADQNVPSGPGISGQPADAAPTDIHDIRHPVQVGVNPAIYYWSIGGIAVLIIALGAWLLIRRRMRRGRKNLSDVTATVYKNPEEEILERLVALENNLPDQPAIFYFRLSGIFRHYLQRRFNVDAPEMTTEELLPRLSGLDLERDMQAGLKTFLKFGDQVKFARAIPGSADMKAHLDLVREMANRFASTESAAGQGEES